ncbi:MAG TPA: DinB family protein, partial [Rhodopila sp.]|nr:DinB family protein [Rhodopila sp.]
MVKFLGLDEQTGPTLSPAQLIDRLDLFLRTAIRIVPQMPDHKLSTEVPNRPRTYLALAHHLFRIPEGLLEVAAGTPLTNTMLANAPPPDMRTSAAASAYGEHVLAALHAWWDKQPDKTATQAVQTYYGPQTLHELMERTTWHCGQHVRQWFMLLDLHGITPSTTLPPNAFANLP